jgi:exopolysaccharide biosynthesis protein
MVPGWLPLLLAAAAWQPVAPGVEHLRIAEEGVDAELLRFDLARFRPEVVVLGPEKPRTAAALRQETGAAAAVNGGFFDEEWHPLGLRIMGGKVVVGLRPRVDWGVLVLRPGRAEIVHSREFRADPAIEQAIQVGPRLLVDGQPLHLKPQAARRTAVALDADGRSLTLVATYLPADAQRLAELLARLGFRSALMFDGGPSSQLSAALGDLHLDLRGGYAVPDALVVRPRSAETPRHAAHP